MTQLKSIGNGIYAAVAARPTLLEQYRLLQATCKHDQRDPQGTCYRCGQRRAS